MFGNSRRSSALRRRGSSVAVKVALVAICTIVTSTACSSTDKAQGDTHSSASSSTSGSARRASDDSQSSPIPEASDDAQVDNAPSTTGQITVGGLFYNINGVYVTASYGSQYLSSNADGEFIVISLTVSNVGNKAADISASDFHLERGTTEYNYADASVYTEQRFAMNTLNPGVSRTGNIVFDVPVNTQPGVYNIKVYGNGADGSQDSREIMLPGFHPDSTSQQETTSVAMPTPIAAATPLPAPTDTGPAPTDTGPAPADTGPAPTDTGPAPTDTGPAKVSRDDSSQP
jgi:hypothetical protein